MTVKTEYRTFTREEFYAFVWSAPATKLAKELGCSDVMIGKTCRAFDIPKPYLGYWAKLANGKNPKRTPLPKNSDPELQSLTFYQHPDYEATVNEPPRELQFDDDIQTMLRRAKELGPVRVPESLRSPHRLIVLTKEDDERRAREEKIPWSQRDPSSRDRRPKRLSFEVTGKLQARAYRVFDSLIKRVEAVGGEVRIVVPENRYGSCSTEVLFGGERISTIRLREKCNQVRITNPKATYDWDRHRTELVPSGLLLLDRGPSDYGGPLAMDGKVRKLEDKLEGLIIEFVRQAGETRIRRRREQELARIKAEQEQIRREREAELKRRRDELLKRKTEESAKVTQLLEHAQGWQRSQLIREYLDALCFSTVGGDGVVVIDSELAKYLRWGFEQADRCDPLSPTPPSVLDEEVDDSDLESGGDYRPRQPR